MWLFFYVWVLVHWVVIILGWKLFFIWDCVFLNSHVVFNLLGRSCHCQLMICANSAFLYINKIQFFFKIIKPCTLKYLFYCGKPHISESKIPSQIYNFFKDWVRGQKSIKIKNILANHYAYKILFFCKIIKQCKVFVWAELFCPGKWWCIISHSDSLSHRRTFGFIHRNK